MIGTTGRFIFPTQCAEANTSIIRAWPNCMRKKRRIAFVSSKPGAPCSTGQRTAASCSAISAVTVTPGWRTWATVRVLEIMIRTLQDHAIHQGITFHAGNNHAHFAEGRWPDLWRLRL